MVVVVVVGGNAGQQKHRRGSRSELSAAVGRHAASEHTLIDERCCVRGAAQAANGRTTKRCFPSAAQPPSNPTGPRTQRLLLHAAALISALTRSRASRTQNEKGDASLTPAPPASPAEHLRCSFTTAPPPHTHTRVYISQPYSCDT